ncbi:MAG: endonuclease/exonuclease/phosphatase family protein [Anaerolineales bacterium]|nr:endonuclease/exonuclease/phosphatase family protein [Anaerolineales bacterium]
MRIITYNLAHRTKVQWVKIFSDFDPDIVLAQETRHPQIDIPEFYTENKDRFLWRQIGTNNWGTALFIKHGEIRQLDLPGFEGWVMGAEISESIWLKTRPRPIRVFSIHVPTKKGSSYVKEMNLILDQIAQLSDNADLIIGGDFNITASFRHHTEERETGKADEAILARLRDDFGLKSCWQTANPDQPLAQTLRWGTNKTTPYHCDGIFAPVTWDQCLASCQVISEGWEALSDHNPVVAIFNL